MAYVMEYVHVSNQIQSAHICMIVWMWSGTSPKKATHWHWQSSDQNIPNRQIQWLYQGRVDRNPENPPLTLPHVLVSLEAICSMCYVCVCLYIYIYTSLRTKTHKNRRLTWGIPRLLVLQVYIYILYIIYIYYIWYVCNTYCVCSFVFMIYHRYDLVIEDTPSHSLLSSIGRCPPSRFNTFSTGRCDQEVTLGATWSTAWMVKSDLKYGKFAVKK